MVAPAGADNTPEREKDDHVTSLKGAEKGGDHRSVDMEVALIRSLRDNGVNCPSLYLFFSAQHDTIFGLKLEGKEAVSSWAQFHKVREKTGFSPIIIGEGRAEHFLVENGLKSRISTSPEQILDTEKRPDGLKPLTPRAWLDQRYSDPESFVKGRWEELEEGEWDEQADKQSVDIVHGLEWLPSGGFHMPTAHEQVTIALVPTPNTLETPAYMKFGWFNECPHPRVHVELLQHWDQKYGLDVIGINSDSMVVHVKNPPTDRDEALALAKDLFTYTNGDGIPGNSRLGFASTLLDGHIWSLWWG